MTLCTDTDMIPKTSFTYAEATELARLLRKVETDKGWMPTQETFEALGAARPLPATDLIILSPKGILLSIYEGGVTKFVGRWHIPGGYVIPNRTIEDDCNANSLRELGINVTVIRTVGVDKWTFEEHSQGQPVSMYMHCRPLTPIVESEKCQFFTLDQLPTNLIESQRRFIEKHLSNLKLWQFEGMPRP